MISPGSGLEGLALLSAFLIEDICPAAQAESAAFMVTFVFRTYAGCGMVLGS